MQHQCDNDERPPSTTFLDPVCGMRVQYDGPHQCEYMAHTHHFCSAGCLARFLEAPGTYSEDTRIQPGESLAAAEFTCPMHPEVTQIGPGDCPICGMALEPRLPSDAEPDDAELRDITRRFWFASVLSAPLVAIVMLGMLPGQPLSDLLSARSWSFIELALATPVCLWAAWPFYVRAVKSVRNLSLNMFTLIGLGVSIAYSYSIVATLFPGLFPDSFRTHGAEVAVYFEAAAVIVTLILLGQVLELRARSQTGAAVKKLLGMAAKSARIIRDDGLEADDG